MADQELRKLLEQLHSEIENAQSIDEQSEKILRDLGADIQGLLERSESSRVQLHPTMVTRLEEAIVNFEATNPALTTTILKILDILSGAGI
jgi:hypothetical protein